MSNSYRPKYHASVPSGWANDPNGTIFYNGKAHLFFQHYPYKAEWGTMHWGHFVTDDFVHWDVLPIALRPDQEYEVICGCCSGSAIEKDGKLYLMYTAAQPELQRQCLAVSEDGGVTFVKNENNPILTADMLSDEVSELDFRDPRLFEKDGWYYFIAGARVMLPKNPGETVPRPTRRKKPLAFSSIRLSPSAVSAYATTEDEDGKPLRSPSAGDVSGADTEREGFGNLILCKSRDLLHWEYVGYLLHRQKEFDEEYYKLQGVYECPDHIDFGDIEVLLTSPQNLPTMGNKYQNLHSGVYIAGELDFDTGRFDVDKFGELDSGFDFYAAQSLRMPDGRVIMIAWKEMWDRNFPTREEGWAGTYTFPRELSMDGYDLIEKPVRELDAFCRNRVFCKSLSVSDSEASVRGVRGNVARIRLTLELGTASKAGVKLFCGEEHETVVSYDKGAGIVTIDRSKSGIPFSGRENEVNIRRCDVGSLDALELELLLDINSLEVFIDGGRHVMTSNVYPDPEDVDVCFFAEGGDAAFKGIEKWDIVV